MKSASAVFAFLIAVRTSVESIAAAQNATARITPAVALRGAPGGIPVNLARLDPDWWRQTTPTTSAPPQNQAAQGGGASTTPLVDSIFSVQVEMCTPFLKMPGTFHSNPEYWKNECKAVPAKATHIKMKVGEVTDYFKPAASKTMCDMLSEGNQHQWSSDGAAWLTPGYNNNQLGGSSPNWLTTAAASAKKLENDKRKEPSFWGVKAANIFGGYGTASYSGAGVGWGKPYQMEYCGMPQELAPICTPLVTVAGSFSADKAFWAEKCKAIPMTAGFVKVAMGDTVDYFRPPTGKSFCEMLTANNIHKWSKDGETWLTPKYDAAAGLGGSAENGVETSDARTKVSSWGSDVTTNTGGCCYASLQDKSPAFGKSFTLSYCEIARATPVAELVNLLHFNEDSVKKLETELSTLQKRLNGAEKVNVDASGNVSLARSGMFKLAARAKNEADELGSFQRRASLLGSNLEQAKTSLSTSEKRVNQAAESAKGTFAIAKKTSTDEALKAQEVLNDKMWKLMDPSNKDSLDATEQKVRGMEKSVDKFRKQLGEEVKTVMVTKMRRTVGRLRRVIHKLGTAGNKNSDEPLGTVESNAPLGADLGLDDN